MFKIIDIDDKTYPVYKLNPNKNALKISVGKLHSKTKKPITLLNKILLELKRTEKIFFE